MAERIPAGHRRVELIEYETVTTDRQRWSWHTVDANYEVIKSAHEPFESKANARRAAERAEGVRFPDGQDWVVIPDPQPVAPTRRDPSRVEYVDDVDSTSFVKLLAVGLVSLLIGLAIGWVIWGR